MTDLNHLIECIRDILPNKYTDDGDPLLCLRSCIERYVNHLDNNVDLATSLQNKEIHEAYVICCLHLFNELTHLEAPKNIETPMFSVFQSQQINQCFEFIICLGVYPLLSPGVSMPLELRLENFDKFKCPSTSNQQFRIQLLSQISDCFHGLLNSNIDALKDLISPNKFLSDYLAVLFQLGFGPYTKEFLNCKSTLDLIRESRSRLIQLLDHLPRPLAFKELFLFQSGFTKKKSSDRKVRAPKWLCDVCGRLLTRLFIAPNQNTSNGDSALRDLIAGVVDVHSTDPRHIPAVASALAHILATPPQSLPSTDGYYHSLAQQITDALANSKANFDSKNILPQITRLISIDTVHAICERDLELGKRLFLKLLLSKLENIVSPDIDEKDRDQIDDPLGIIDVSDVKELLSAEDLYFVVDIISKLLDTRHPSPALCGLLARYSQIWFHFCSLLNLAAPGSAEFEDDGENQVKEESAGLSPADEFKSKLLSILSNHLLDPESSFRLIRSWISLPALDPTTLEPLDLSKENSPIIPLNGSVILRPASLITTDTKISESNVPRAPFRVTRSAEAIPEHSLELISSKVKTVMELLAPKVNESLNTDASNQVDDERLSEEKAEELLNVWRNTNEEGDSEKLRANLVAKLLLSLISDINSRIMNQEKHHQMEPGVQLFVQSKEISGEEVRNGLTVPLTACLLASAMLESFDPSNLWPSEPALAVKLISLTLTRLCAIIDSVTDKEVIKMAEESLNLILGITAFFVNYMEKGDKVSTEVRNHFGELIPLMKKVESTFPKDSASTELAQQIRVALLTRGAFSVSDPVIQSPKTDPPPKKRLIEELASTSEATDTSQHVYPSKPDSEMPPQLVEVFKLLNDSFIPVKGHALIELSRLLESKDSCIVGFEDKIYQTLVEYLDHEDSYIYLNAIRGLSAIGNAFTDRLLPLLLKRFQEKSANVEFRLKVGEALVRILRELGEIAPKYRDEVATGLLSASKDESEFIRAAGLSNLAEICQLLGKSIQSVIYEVFNVVEHCLKYDVSPLVRKSAAYLAGGLFRSGPSISRRDQLARLPGEIIRDIHRLLRDRAMIEKDEGVLEQIEAAMFEVDACAREATFRSLDKPGELIKEIRVLRPFDP